MFYLLAEEVLPLLGLRGLAITEVLEAREVVRQALQLAVEAEATGEERTEAIPEWALMECLEGVEVLEAIQLLEAREATSGTPTQMVPQVQEEEVEVVQPVILLAPAVVLISLVKGTMVLQVLTPEVAGAYLVEEALVVLMAFFNLPKVLEVETTEEEAAIPTDPEVTELLRLFGA